VTTGQAIMKPSAAEATEDEDDIESELCFSVREVGVACFPILDEGDG